MCRRSSSFGGTGHLHFAPTARRPIIAIPPTCRLEETTPRGAPGLGLAARGARGGGECRPRCVAARPGTGARPTPFLGLCPGMAMNYTVGKAQVAVRCADVPVDSKKLLTWDEKMRRIAIGLSVMAAVS